MVKCKYCGKEFDNPQKLGGHVTHCKMNPNYDKNKLNCNNFIKKSAVYVPDGIFCSGKLYCFFLYFGQSVDS